jgi:hypothetical protein
MGWECFERMMMMGIFMIDGKSCVRKLLAFKGCTLAQAFAREVNSIQLTRQQSMLNRC